MRSARVPRWLVVACVLTVASAAASFAQTPTIAVETPECLPIGEFTPVYAKIAGEPGGSQVRLYFRRLHEEVEDFYYVVMEPNGDGRYYAVLPKPEDRELEDRRFENPDTDDEEQYREAAWWKDKESSEDRDPNDDLDRDVIEERASVGGEPEDRTWMNELGYDELEEWLEEVENEPGEMFVAVFDASGRLLAKSDMLSTYVTEDCDVELTAKEAGFANNLVIGETAPWQIGEPVFHWLCDGIVTRIDHLGIKREDDFCRACVVAWWRTRALLPLVGTSSIVLITPRDDEPVSPSQP